MPNPNPFRFLWKNRDTLLLAFLLAAAVWVSAVIASDPNREDVLGTSVPLEVVGLDSSLILLTNLPTSVEVALRAPESLWLELEKNPELISAVVDFTGIGSGEHTLPIDVQLEISPTQILEISPNNITVTLEQEVSVEMPVSLNLVGEVALGFEIKGRTIEPDTVTITGPESRVSLVSEVVGTISIAGAREDITTTLSLVPVDEENRQISDVTVVPSQVDAQVNITQVGGYRDVAVKVETTGQPATGYRVTFISVSPPTITVFSSSPELVNEMTGVVSTQPLDLTDASEDIETRLGISLPEGVSMVGDEQSVQVTIGIAAIETSISLNVPIQVGELGTGLRASLSPNTVDVFLTGPLPVVEGLTPDDVIIFVSLSDLGPGTYLVEPQFDVLLENVVLESINPDTIEVIITERDGTEDPTSTPTPDGSSTQSNPTITITVTPTP